MANIEVISSCLVGMASNESSMSRMELTPWDLQLLQLDPIERGILFHKPQSQQIDKNFIDHLKNSLSRTLDIFPPLSGRIGTTENDDNTMFYFINCNNGGVEFIHAVADAVSVSDILEPRYKPEILFSFFPLYGISNCEGVSKPLLGVQVTELVDGLFIGCTANHAIVDGTSFWHFFNSWSEISRGFDSISKATVFERWFPISVANDNRLVPLPPLEQNLLQNFVPPPLLERVFHISKESLAKLKVKSNSEAATDKISTLQALSTHLWRSTTRCRHSLQSINDLSEEARFLMITIGARARIPLPDGYFGNAFYGTTIVASEAELLQKGLGYTALKINEVVAKQTHEAIIKSVEDWVKNPRLFRKSGKVSSTIVMITSSPRHNVYDNDFGWGKPIAVRSGKAQKFDGNMIVYPAAVAGGIDVEVCLAPETLQAMENDAEFMEAIAI